MSICRPAKGDESCTWLSHTHTCTHTHAHTHAHTRTHTHTVCDFHILVQYVHMSVCVCVFLLRTVLRAAQEALQENAVHRSTHVSEGEQHRQRRWDLLRVWGCEALHRWTHVHGHPHTCAHFSTCCSSTLPPPSSLPPSSLLPFRTSLRCQRGR